MSEIETIRSDYNSSKYMYVKWGRKTEQKKKEQINKKVKIVAVSYLNTVPFIYGIEHHAPQWLKEALELAIPSRCADSLIEGWADIALMPVAEIPKIKGAKIITDYCISANGLVDTVALLSNSPLEKIKRVYLDNHSRTSVLLAQVLAKEYWKITPQWISGIPERIAIDEAIVAIGDKVFDIEKEYSHKWDLSQEWKAMTNLPFVFAAWVAGTEKGKEAESELNKALAYGCENIGKSIPRDRFDYEKSHLYLTQNIEFRLDNSKREALKLFLDKITML